MNSNDALLSRTVPTPRIVTTAADEASMPDSPSTPLRSARYPTSLSRTSGTANVARTPHRRGASKQYETLEDLLTAAGYKETRVVTPIRTRASSGSSSRESHVDPLAAAGTTEKGLGRRLSNFLSAWMPGASVSLGRARGAEIVREEYVTKDYRNNLHRALSGADITNVDSPFLSQSGINGSSERIPVSQALSHLSKLRARIPADFITEINQQDHMPIAPLRTTGPLLRHVATSPNLKRPNDGAVHSGRRSPMPPRNGEVAVSRGRTLAVRDENAQQNSFLAPPHTTKLKFAPRARAPRRKATTHDRHSNVVTPVATLAPVLNSKEVVCRSTPQSRSASRVRGSVRHSLVEDVPPVPPLLSAAVVEDSLNAWLQNNNANNHTLSQGSTARYKDIGDEDDDPGLGHIVFSRLSDSLGTASVSRSSSGSTPHTQSLAPSSTAAFSSSGKGPYAPDRPDRIRRERSIQSLRAHLAPRRQRSQLLAAARSPEAGVTSLSRHVSLYSRAPDASSWLDGPEWNGAMHKPASRGSSGSSRRRLIPWFGGEGAFLERPLRDRNANVEQDE